MIRKFAIFEKSQECEIMFIASLMKTKVTVSQEEVINQGDFGAIMYVICEGQVNVKLQDSIV